MRTVHSVDVCYGNLQCETGGVFASQCEMYGRVYNFVCSSLHADGGAI